MNEAQIAAMKVLATMPRPCSLEWQMLTPVMRRAYEKCAELVADGVGSSKDLGPVRDLRMEGV